MEKKRKPRGREVGWKEEENAQVTHSTSKDNGKHSRSRQEKEQTSAGGRSCGLKEHRLCETCAHAIRVRVRPRAFFFTLEHRSHMAES
eukprot:3935212-Rhodomonas_salina.1